MSFTSPFTFVGSDGSLSGVVVGGEKLGHVSLGNP